MQGEEAIELPNGVFSSATGPGSPQKNSQQSDIAPPGAINGNGVETEADKPIRTSESTDDILQLEHALHNLEQIYTTGSQPKPSLPLPPDPLVSPPQQPSVASSSVSISHSNASSSLPGSPSLARKLPHSGSFSRDPGVLQRASSLPSTPPSLRFSRKGSAAQLLPLIMSARGIPSNFRLEDLRTESRSSSRASSSKGEDDRAESEEPLPADPTQAAPVATIGRPTPRSLHNLHVLRLFIVTWNMQGKQPPIEPLSFIPVQEAHDIYVIGTQECERSVGKSLVVTSKQKWEAKLDATFGDAYKRIRTHTMGAVHLAVYVRDKLVNLITNIQSDHVPCGLGNVANNKGAVGISFSYGKTSFLFINSHFTAHLRNVKQRDSDYHRINNELPLFPNPKEATSYSAGSAPAGEGKCVTDRFHRVFWLGDLNYRLHGNKSSIEQLIKQEMFEVLIANDQLNKSRRQGDAFPSFIEGPLSFKPTYKFDAGTDQYDTSAKARVPAWTDRILFKPDPSISLTHYDAVHSVHYTDHRPVVAHFEIGYQLQEEEEKPKQKKKGICVLV